MKCLTTILVWMALIFNSLSSEVNVEENLSTLVLSLDCDGKHIPASKLFLGIDHLIQANSLSLCLMHNLMSPKVSRHVSIIF